MWKVGIFFGAAVDKRCVCLMDCMICLCSKFSHLLLCNSDSLILVPLIPESNDLDRLLLDFNTKISVYRILCFKIPTLVMEISELYAF